MEVKEIVKQLLKVLQVYRSLSIPCTSADVVCQANSVASVVEFAEGSGRGLECMDEVRNGKYQLFERVRTMGINKAVRFLTKDGTVEDYREGILGAIVAEIMGGLAGIDIAERIVNSVEEGFDQAFIDILGGGSSIGEAARNTKGEDWVNKFESVCERFGDL